MVKILICGDIQSEWSLLKSKLTTLNNSQHGPFHVCFCTGLFFKSMDEFQSVHETLDIPIPMYFFDNIGLADCPNLPKNLHILKSAGILTIERLTIAFLADIPAVNVSSECDAVKSICSSKAYRGCDLFLSQEWPLNLHHFISDVELDTLRSSVGIGVGSQLAATLATTVLPRYHFSGKRGLFYQRAPYRNRHHSQATCPCTRFIALAPVSSSKEKSLKWIHALSLEPITHMSNAEIADEPDDTTDNPYIEINAVLGPRLPPTDIPPLPDSNLLPVAKKSRFEEQYESSAAVSTGSFFFGSAVTKGQSTRALNTVAPSDFAKVLFVGGLHPNTKESEVYDAFPDCVSIRRPDGKGFAFVEFSSHDAASRVMRGAPPIIRGRPLSVGWAKEKGPDTNGSHKDNGALSRFDDSRGSKIYGPGGNGSGDGGTSVRTGTLLGTSESQEPVSQDVKTLFVGGVDVGVQDCDLMSLFPGCESIRRPEGKSFAFVQFTTHEDAVHAMRDCDGRKELLGRVLRVAWGSQKGPEDRVGLGPSRVAGSHECWFCLSSPAAKLHLVMSVSEHCYLALARGGVCDLHVLVAPVECVHSRVLLSPEAMTDLSRYESALEKAFSSLGACVLKVERVLARTDRSTNHMQVQFVAVPRERVSVTRSSLLELSEQENISFHELKEVETMEEKLKSLGSWGPHTEYLYLEVPVPVDGVSLTSGIARHRCLYVHSPSTPSHSAVGTGTGRKGAQRFPMNFGNELAARILGCPERAQWRNCVLGTEEEEAKVANFRQLFEPFDFTLL